MLKLNKNCTNDKGGKPSLFCAKFNSVYYLLLSLHFQQGDFVKKTFLGFSLTTNNKIYLILSLVFLGIVTRVIPHLPNSTALLFSSLMFGYLVSRSFALLLTLFISISSDVLISFIYGYPVFGYWSWFTYSGFLVTAFMGSCLNSITFRNSTISLLSASLLFWVWTNLGVWLVAGLYSKTISGLIACYIAALPFLKNQLMGDLVCLGALGLVSIQPFAKKFIRA